MSLTPINRSAISEQMALDLQKSLSIHPNSFECLLFRADLNALEDHTPNQEDVVGNLEAREETFSYSSPVKTRALELPNNDSSSVMLALGDDTDDGETPITMLIQAQSVPEQSVLWYEELVDDNNIKVTLMYVLSAKPIGKHGKGGFKYDLVPFDLGSDFLPDKFEVTPDEPLEFLPNPHPDPSLTDVINRLSAAATPEKIAQLRNPVPEVSESDVVTDESLNKQARNLQDKVGTVADIFDVFQSDNLNDNTD